jgi:hypothetical protein
MLSREELEDLEGTSVASQLKVDYFSAIRFAAKVALGGGYFVYGDLLRDAIDCDELRRLISLDVTAARQDPLFEAMKARICHRFHPDVFGGSAEALRDRLLCEYTGRSTFICVPYQDAVGFHVGVLGMYMGSIFLPADTSCFPLGDGHDLGHVILLSPGKMERLALRKFASSLEDAIAASSDVATPKG